LVSYFNVKNSRLPAAEKRTIYALFESVLEMFYALFEIVL